MRPPWLPEEQGFSASYRRLREAQKTSFGAPAYSLVVNRPLGRVFAAAAFQTGATPNQVTALGSALTYAGILAVALVAPAWWVGLLVCVLLVARLRARHAPTASSPACGAAAAWRASGWTTCSTRARSSPCTWRC